MGLVVRAMSSESEAVKRVRPMTEEEGAKKEMEAEPRVSAASVGSVVRVSVLRSRPSHPVCWLA